ncbi:MAG: ADP-ribosylglycohydrolase family protein [Flavobacteriia bacterium]
MNSNQEAPLAPILFGAIAGDIIGSVYEKTNCKSTSFKLFLNVARFTDDSVMTIALADSILNTTPIAQTLQRYGRKYPNAGYGGTFFEWIFQSEPKPYNSWGNGSAMRVSPVGWAYHSEDEVLEQAKISAEVSHNHPEGIKGAQATAMSVFLARTGSTKEEIKTYVEKTFNYDLSQSIDDIRPAYKFDVSCQGSVPQAIRAFYESTDYESTIRLAISLGGDSDTIACIAGGIAQAYYKTIPQEIVQEVMQRLTKELLEVVLQFDETYNASEAWQDRK